MRLGSGPIAVYSYTAIGKPEPFSISATVSPADFNAAEFDLFAWTQLPSGPLYGMPPSWTPLADLMNVEGRLTVKYHYASADPAASVPEPSSLALLGVGLFGIGTIRKTRSRFQRLRAIGWRATADDDEHYVYAIGPPTKAAAPDLPIFRSQTHRGSCHRQQCDDASAVPFLEAEV